MPSAGEFDHIVVAARYQPPLHEHFEAIAAAAARAREVLVLCLAADESLSLNNPWTTDERRTLLAAGVDAATPVRYASLRDLRYDGQRWRERLQDAVAAAATAAVGVYLFACDEDGAPLPLPPAWQQLPLPPAAMCAERRLRATLFEADESALPALLRHRAPAAVAAAASRQLRGARFAHLREEARFIASFKADWAAAPYPPLFMTVDALVEWRGSVLLVRRGRCPGKGLLALPGGFINRSETLLAGCLRELAEETAIAVDAGVLKRSEVDCRLFDAPYRSLRGRTITQVFHFDLSDLAAPPAVCGGDDASAAVWAPRAGVRPQDMFEDHYAIVQVLLGLP